LWSFNGFFVVSCLPGVSLVALFSVKNPQSMPNFENSPKIEFLGYGGVLGVKLKLFESNISLCSLQFKIGFF
jgi:hypothetical protein